MRFLAGGRFLMGSEQFYPEELPLRAVEVSPFWIDRHPVTNAQFAAFVAATGYRTLAEKALDIGLYEGLAPEEAAPGSLVFHRTPEPVDLSDHSLWWTFVYGASWQQPLGPGSSTAGTENHPVVHVALADAEAYCRWAGKSLPTEAEWEFAARGGLAAAEYAWGDELSPGGAQLANYWQGAFPYSNLLLDGYERTSPVGAFPPNGFDLLDMIGNVWEWTADWYVETPGKPRSSPSCCVPRNPRGGRKHDSFDPATPHLRMPRRVIKGGSHLCAPNYCQRYRPAARQGQAVDSSTSHIGFRCVVRKPMADLGE